MLGDPPRQTAAKAPEVTEDNTRDAPDGKGESAPCHCHCRKSERQDARQT